MRFTKIPWTPFWPVDVLSWSHATSVVSFPFLTYPHFSLSHQSQSWKPYWCPYRQTFQTDTESGHACGGSWISFPMKGVGFRRCIVLWWVCRAWERTRDGIGRGWIRLNFTCSPLLEWLERIKIRIERSRNLYCWLSDLTIFDKSLKLYLVTPNA